MDIEAIVRKYAGDIRLFGDVMRAALTEQAAGYEERIRHLEAERVPSPSCRECANRGRVNGLSQETYCDSCVWQGQSFRVNQYAAAQQPKKEGE